MAPVDTISCMELNACPPAVVIPSVAGLIGPEVCFDRPLLAAQLAAIFGARYATLRNRLLPGTDVNVCQLLLSLVALAAIVNSAVDGQRYQHEHGDDCTTKEPHL